MQSSLYIPKSRADLLERPRLSEKLDNALSLRLILISAPAGFGKTSLISSWAAKLPYKCCWLSLNDSITDSIQFLRYFISALRTIKPDVCNSVLSAIESPKTPDALSVFPFVVDELAGMPELVFVLDDYHLINDQNTDFILEKLIKVMPPHFHLVISTRSDPLFSLSLLRGRRELCEIRADHLRFSGEETFYLLTELHHQELQRTETDSLYRKTEGWITGLQMALLSLEERENKNNFIKDFSASNIFILDYLMEQVLSSQKAEMREFLLCTSVLNRMSAELCKEVTENKNAGILLEDAVRSNMFIQPLDSNGEWFRYHHLFRELLLNRLKINDNTRISVLHKNAMRWFRSKGDLYHAINHSIASKEFDSVLDLLSKYIKEIWSKGEQQQLSIWISKIPTEKLHCRPDILAQYALTLSFAGRFSEAEELINVLNQASENRITPGLFSLIKAFHAIWRGKIEEARLYNKEGMKQLAENDHIYQTLAYSLYGDICVFDGLMKDCETVWIKAMDHAMKAENIFLSHWAGAKVIISRKRLGKLAEAGQTYNLLTTERKGISDSAVSGAYYSVAGDIFLEWLNTDKALNLFEKGLFLSERQDYTGGIAWSSLSLIHARYLLSEYELVEKGIETLESRIAGGRLPDWTNSWLSAWKIRFYLYSGEIKKAENILRDRKIEISGKINYPREIEYLELARYYLAKEPEKASGVISVLKKRFREICWIDRWYEACLLEILHLKITGNQADAVDKLNSLLSATAPEKYSRLYIIERQPVAELLYSLIEQKKSTEEAGRLLELAPRYAGEKKHQNSGIEEPLSERELAVLAVIASGKTNKEAADELFISEGTVKNHLKSIFKKMNVGSRTQAAAHARALGLIK